MRECLSTEYTGSAPGAWRRIQLVITSSAERSPRGVARHPSACGLDVKSEALSTRRHATVGPTTSAYIRKRARLARLKKVIEPRQLGYFEVGVAVSRERRRNCEKIPAWRRIQSVIPSSAERPPRCVARHPGACGLDEKSEGLCCPLDGIARTRPRSTLKSARAASGETPRDSRPDDQRPGRECLLNPRIFESAPVGIAVSRERLRNRW